MRLFVLNCIYNLFIKYYNYSSSLITPLYMWDEYPFMTKILMWKCWEKCEAHPLKRNYFKQMIKDIKDNLNLEPKNKINF